MVDILSINRIKFGDRVIPQMGKDNIILHNLNSGKVAIVSNELYGILKYICDNKKSLSEAFKLCETNDDRLYLEKNLRYLMEKNIIRDAKDCTEYDELDMRIDLDITNKCNLHCRHCCVDASNMCVDLSTEDMFSIMDKISETHPKLVTISGGEPLMRKDFKEIICRLRSKYNGVLGLMSNLTLVDEEMAYFIAEKFDTVSTSLDGVDEKTCSAIRGKGVFDKTIRGIKKLKAAGAKEISASMVITKLTENRREEFKALCNDLGIDMMYRALGLIGRAEKEMLDLVPEGEDVKTEKKDIDYTYNNKRVPERFFSCSAGYRQFQIDYRGKLYPCQLLMYDEFSLGNVLKIEKLNDYIRKRLLVTTQGYKNLEKYFPYNYAKCSGCNRQMICWSCIASIYKGIGEKDSCQVMKELYKELLG